jgi:hypothetical protein
MDARELIYLNVCSYGIILGEVDGQPANLATISRQQMYNHNENPSPNLVQ